MITQTRLRWLAIVLGMAIVAVITATFAHLLLNSKPFKERPEFRVVAIALVCLAPAFTFAITLWMRRLRVTLLPLVMIATTLAACAVVFAVGTGLVDPYESHPSMTVTTPDRGWTPSRPYMLRIVAGRFVRELTGLTVLGAVAAGVSGWILQRLSRRRPLP